MKDFSPDTYTASLRLVLSCTCPAVLRETQHNCSAFFIFENFGQPGFRAKAHEDAAVNNPGLKAGVKEFSDEGL